jgi:RNase P protein component
MVVIARKGVQSCEFADYEREIMGALAAKGLLKKRSTSTN